MRGKNYEITSTDCPDQEYQSSVSILDDRNFPCDHQPLSQFPLLIKCHRGELGCLEVSSHRNSLLQNLCKHLGIVDAAAMKDGDQAPSVMLHTSLS